MADPALIFDIGNVLVTFDFARATEHLRGRVQMPLEGILSALSQVKLALESGQMDEQSFFGQAVQLTGFSGSEAEFETAWCDIFSIHEPMLRTLEALAARPGCPRMLLLSNTNEPHLRWLLAHFPEVFQHFSGGVYSHRARCMKPDEGIYHTLFQQEQVAPELAFYIDDLSENIATGQRLGLSCHTYALADHTRLVHSLEEWLLRLP